MFLEIASHLGLGLAECLRNACLLDKLRVEFLSECLHRVAVEQLDLIEACAAMSITSSGEGLEVEADDMRHTKAHELLSKLFALRNV